MNRLISYLAFGTTLLLTTGAYAAPAKVFEGVGVVLTAKDCETEWNPSDRFLLRYTPSDLTGNPASSRMTMFNHTFAQAYETTSGRFTTSLTNVQAMVIGTSAYTVSPSAMVALAITNAVDASVFLNLTKGTITQFGANPGCIVTFRAGLVLRP